MASRGPPLPASRGLLLLFLALLTGAPAAGAAEAPANCTARLDAMSHCKARLAGQAACSVEALLTNATVRALLGCQEGGSLPECQAKCLDALGTLGLPVSSAAPPCTASEQLMEQHSGSPGLIFEFVPSPSGLPKPRIIPARFAEMSSIPSFAFLGDYQGCTLGDGMQYCLVDGKLPLGGMGLTGLLGLCRPVECSEGEVRAGVKGALGPLHLEDFRVTCHAPQEQAPAVAWTGGRIAAAAVFAALALLAALATGADLQAQWRREAATPPDAAPLCDGAERQAPSRSLLSAFSLVRNGESFSRPRPQDPKAPALACLDGLRVLSTLWVILGHCVIWPLLSVQYEQSSEILPPKGRLTEYWFQIVPGGYFAVDTFFWLSGFLGALSLHAKVQRSPQLLSLTGFVGKLYPTALLHRWLRLSVVYAFVLLFTQTWYRPIGRAGPLWDADTSFGGSCVGSIDNDKCKSYWWANLLYVNNLNSAINSCMLWTWYLACDMQMFLTLPLFVLLRERGGKLLGWLMLAACLLASIAANWVIIWDNKLVTDPVLGNAGANGKFMQDVYEVAWTRCQPYLIGIGCAWVLGVLHSRSARDLAGAGAGADQEAPASASADLGPQNMARSLLGGQADEPAPKAPTEAAAGAVAGSGPGDLTSARPRRRMHAARRAALAVALQLLSFAAMCFVVFIPATRYRCEKFSDCLDIDKSPWSPTANALYGSLNHAVWGLGLGVLVVLCALRTPGTWWVNTLLGAEFWQKPAKLSYIAYLIHPLVLVLFYCTRLRPVQYLDSILVQNFVAYAAIVFMASFFVWLAVEKPAANLTAQLMGALTGGARRG